MAIIGGALYDPDLAIGGAYEPVMAIIGGAQ